jgi:type I restriction enzyme, S subunit
MKDSGIEWLGDVPEHWEVRKLKYLGRFQNGISASAEYFGSGFPFVSYGDVYKNFELPKIGSGLANSSEQDRKIYSVEKGDVFFTRTSETIEEIGFTATCFTTIENATFSGFIIRFRPYKNLLFEGFSKFYFRSTLHRRFFVKEMNLVTRASLSQELLKKLPVLLPPLSEQQAILTYIEKETALLTQTINTIEREITLVQEYRTTLIAEAVTGKIDVRSYELVVMNYELEEDLVGEMGENTEGPDEA